MKILLVHIYYTNRSSGASAIVYSTFDSLKKSGHEPYIFATDAKPYYDENYPYIKYFPRNKDSWNNASLFDYCKKQLKKIYNKEASDNLAKMLDEVKPDIVHIHTVWELSYSIIKPIKDRHIPIIYTAHDPQICCPAIFDVGTKYCTNCQGLNSFPCIQKKCANGNFVISLYTAIKSFIDRLLFPISVIDKIITPSQATMDYMCQFGIPKDKFVVLDNFIPKEMIKELPNYSDKNYFLFAGGIHKQKGVYTLIRAMNELPRDIELHIAGESTVQEEYDDINNYIKNNNLQNVKFLGRLSKEQMQEEYKNCISVIMPSEWFETFGMINIEAAIYGKPSISSNIGGLSDVVEDGKTGLIFEPKNVEQLKKCILKYWNNRDLAIEHGKAARKKALREYNEDLYFERLIKIYKEVINNAK